MAEFYDPEPPMLLGDTLGASPPSASPGGWVGRALMGAAYSLPPGREMLQAWQQQQYQQHEMHARKRQADQQGMQRFAELLGQYGQLPAGPHKDFFGKTLGRMYQDHTGQPLDQDFLAMVKKQDEEQTAATADFVRQLATQYGVNLQGFDTLIKSQPDKAMALVLQRLQTEKSAVELQRGRTRAQALQQLQQLPGALSGAGPGAGAPALPVEPLALFPGAEGPIVQTPMRLPGSQLPPAGASADRRGLALPPPGVAGGTRADGPLAPGNWEARRQALTTQMERLLPLTAEDEGINKAYHNLANEVKRLDDQAHRAFTEAKQLRELDISRTHLGVSQAQLQVSRMNAVREAQDSVLRRQELSMNIAKHQRETTGGFTETEKRKLVLEARGDIRQEKAYKDFQSVRGGYQTLQEGFHADSTAGDLAVVNGINRLFNPDSTVMLGEARNVEQAQGTLQQLLNLPRQFFTGQRLSAEFRPQLMELGKALYTRWSTQADQDLAQIYGPIASQIGVPTDRLYVSPLKALEEKPVGLNKTQREKIEQLLKETGFK